MDKKDEKIYPCIKCGLMRSQNEGGTTFTVCDECWGKNYSTKVKQIDRLLSEHEIEDADMGITFRIMDEFYYEEIESMLKCQVAKTDIEWVKWGESICPHVDEDLGGEYVTNNYRISCGQCWQERKKGLGL